MLPVDSQDHLEKLNPNFSNMTSFCHGQDVVGMHASALTNNAETTAIYRNFAPRYGIDEESATGTSSRALVCYLFKHYKQQSQYILSRDLTSVLFLGLWQTLYINAPTLTLFMLANMDTGFAGKLCLYERKDKAHACLYPLSFKIWSISFTKIVPIPNSRDAAWYFPM